MSVAGLPQTVESTCEKVAYRSQRYAVEAAREHREESAPCRACRRGGRMEAYHCDGHHHIGHRWGGRVDR